MNECKYLINFDKIGNHVQYRTIAVLNKFIDALSLFSGKFSLSCKYFSPFSGIGIRAS